MKRRLFLVVLTLVLSVSVCRNGYASHSEAEQAATDAALTWLAMLDKGDYSGTWKETARPFQKAVGEARWAESASAARCPYPLPVKREVMRRKYTTQLPEGVKGEFVIIQFKAHYQKKDAIETITPMLEDGRWRVSGYYIKPVGGEQFVEFSYMGLAVLFIILGNVMPKLRPNKFIGIRTPWTLGSDEVWARAHRTGGKVMVAGGVIMLALVYVVPLHLYLVCVLLPVVVGTSIFTMIHSYVLHKKLNSAGAA